MILHTQLTGDLQSHSGPKSETTRPLSIALIGSASPVLSPSLGALEGSCRLVEGRK